MVGIGDVDDGQVGPPDARAKFHPGNVGIGRPDDDAEMFVGFERLVDPGKIEVGDALGIFGR